MSELTKEKTMSELSPKDALDNDTICRMESDNFPLNDGGVSIMNNGPSVSLHFKKGDGGGWLEIPKDQFNAIIEWYMKPQTLSEATHD